VTGFDQPKTRRAGRFYGNATLAILLATSIIAGNSLPARAASLPEGAIHPQTPSQHIPDFADLTAEVRPAVVSVTNKLKQSPQDQTSHRSAWFRIHYFSGWLHRHQQPRCCG